MRAVTDLHCEVLSVRGVTVRFNAGQRNEFEALRSADLTVRRGETVAIVGPSGSGKTTLVSVAALLRRPDEGQVLVAGVETSALPSRRRAWMRSSVFGLVTQRGDLHPHWTARENVRFTAAARGHRVGANEVDALLDSLGLVARVHAAMPAELSGGERQRVAIARALIGSPQVVFADEPTSALDSASAASVLEVLNERRGKGVALVLVTHDLSIAEAAGARIVRVEDGRASLATV